MENILLSVIVPVYNAREYLVECISSILQQTFKDFELFLVDDASTDNSLEIIKSFNDPRVRIIKNEVNLGKNGTVNNVLGLTRGKYLTIHDADDFSDLTRFQKQINFLETHPEFVLVGTSFYELIGKRRELIKMPTDYEEIKSALPLKSQFHGPTMVFRKEIISNIGGLYRYFTWGEDIDFSARVVEKYQATNLNDPLYTYRIHEKSLTKNVSLLTPERLVNAQLRVFLASQRKQSGYDCLMEGKIEKLEAEKEKLLKKFSEDPGLVYWELSQTLYYYSLMKQAVTASWKAVLKQPSLRNLKNLGFMLFSWIFNPAHERKS